MPALASVVGPGRPPAASATGELNQPRRLYSINLRSRASPRAQAATPALARADNAQWRRAGDLAPEGPRALGGGAAALCPAAANKDADPRASGAAAPKRTRESLCAMLAQCWRVFTGRAVALFARSYRLGV